MKEIGGQDLDLVLAHWKEILLTSLDGISSKYNIVGTLIHSAFHI